MYCGLGFADFPQGPVRRVAFLPNGKQIVTGGKNCKYIHTIIIMYTGNNNLSGFASHFAIQISDAKVL